MSGLMNLNAVDNMSKNLDGIEITPHYCEMVTKLAISKDFAGSRWYLLGHMNRALAEKAAESARGCGYNARIIDDFGTAVYIKKSLRR